MDARAEPTRLSNGCAALIQGGGVGVVGGGAAAGGSWWCWWRRAITAQAQETAVAFTLSLTEWRWKGRWWSLNKQDASYFYMFYFIIFSFIQSSPSIVAVHSHYNSAVVALAWNHHAPLMADYIAPVWKHLCVCLFVCFTTQTSWLGRHGVCAVV